MNEIAWESLKHNYGSGADVPTLLRDILDPQRADDAVFKLSNHLHHQGGWICSAAVAALPYLVELACTPAACHRTELVELLGDLARTARRCRKELVADGWGSAWRGTLPALTELLDDPDPGLRRMATYPLSAGQEAGHLLIQCLRDRWGREEDTAVLVSMMVAAKMLAADGTDEDVRLVRDWLAGAEEHPLAEVRLAALVCSPSSLLRDQLDAAVQLLLEEELAGLREAHLWVGPARGSTVRWVYDTLKDDADSQTELCLRLLDAPRADRRVGAANSSARLLMHRRSPQPRLLPALAKRMSDPDIDVRRVAVHLVAVAGNTAHADLLASAATDQTPFSQRLSGTVGDIAVWGLARLGDARCVAPLVEHITHAVTAFGYNSGHYSADFYWVVLPGIHEVLGRVPQYAADLLPAVRTQLRAATLPNERRALCQTITAWGPAASEAVPELIALLHSDTAEWAAEALAAIGSAANAADSRLRQLALDAEVNPRVRRTAAWALWKVCGDPTAALSVLRMDLRTGGLGSAVQRVADLGAEARPLLPQVRELLDSEDAWTQAQAAHAVWAISGEPDKIVPILQRIILPLGEGQMLPVMQAAVHCLGKIGPAAIPVVPLLQQALATDRRLSYGSGWRAIHEDEEFRNEIHDALVRIDAR
ncbi:hypothetical protein [Sinosporangium siamense]|uniref:hypothetical protein n=1 Tax=Sinosporangium siamense TaxID=1367973 RepID=UPI0036D2C933